MSLISQRYLKLLGAFLPLFLAYAFSIYKSQFGIDFTDEGFYVSTIWRLGTGDVPFRDEIMGGTTLWYVFIVTPLFKLFPKISMLDVRILGVSLQFATMAAIVFSLRANPFLWLISLAAAFAGLTNNYFGMWTLSYNLMGSCFAILSLICFLEINEARKSSYYGPLFLSALFFSLALISYPTLLILTAFFLALFLVQKNQRRSIFFFLLLTGILTLGWILYYFSGDGLAYFQRNISLIFGPGNIAQNFSLWQRIWAISTNLTSLIRNGFLFFVANFIGLAGIFFLRRTQWPHLLLVLLFSCEFFYIYRVEPDYSFSVIFLSVIWALNLLFLHLSTDFLRLDQKLKISFLWSFFIMAIFCFSTHYFNYYRSYQSGTQGLPVFWVCLVIVMGSFVKQIKNLFYQKAALAILLVAFIFNIKGVIRYQYNSTYRESDFSKLTAQFQEGSLKGIYSTPERVKTLEALKQKLDSLGAERIFAFVDVPLLYYALDKKPAYGSVWARNDHPPLMIQFQLKDMKERYGLPVIVRSHDGFVAEELETTPVELSPDKSLYDQFLVENNYKLSSVFGPFQVWESSK